MNLNKEDGFYLGTVDDAGTFVLVNEMYPTIRYLLLQSAAEIDKPYIFEVSMGGLSIRALYRWDTDGWIKL